MEGFNQERRGLFDGLKVPFDVNAIILAALGVFVFHVGVRGIEYVLDLDPETKPLLLGMLGNLIERLGPFGAWIKDQAGLTHGHVPFQPVAWIFLFLWSSVVWAFFSAAICRIAAMKVAREEGLEIKDALLFAKNKFMPNLLSIAFVLAIVGFFFVICDATIAGWIGRIPYIGEILVAVLFFLVLLSAFFIIFAAVLGILGFNLAAAAIATEASDTFDGVSRAWNYILARPWQVLLTYGLTFAYIGVFLVCAHWFQIVAVKSLSIGGWGMGANVDETIVRDEDARALNYESGQRVALPGKAEFLYKRLVAHDPLFSQKDPVTKKDVLYYEQKDSDGNPLPVRKDGKDVPGETRWVNVYPVIPGTLKFSAWVISLWLHLARLLIVAYAVSYFFSAMTVIYFLLRKDVEGDDYTEINLEDEDDDDDSYEYGNEAGSPPKPHSDAKPLPIAPVPGPTTSGTPLPASGPAPEKKDDHHDHKH